jgi:hypothetical protein
MKRLKKQSKGKTDEKNRQKIRFFPNKGITDPTYFINQTSFKKITKKIMIRTQP